MTLGAHVGVRASRLRVGAPAFVESPTQVSVFRPRPSEWVPEAIPGFWI